MPFTRHFLILILQQGKSIKFGVEGGAVFLIYNIRALVGSNLEGKANLQIDLTAIKAIDNVKRDVMHVQGISYWAPANIGPYSQSIIVSSMI